MKDFFVSYNRHDKDWAELIAWILEENGYTVTIQAWDFRPGGNFAIDMDKAIKNSKRTIAVLSETYLQSEYALPEWTAAFINDPTSTNHKLVPVKVRPCEPDGLLQGIVYADLIDTSEKEAKIALLSAIHNGRGKPDFKPSFPGKTPAEDRIIPTQKAFPHTEAHRNLESIKNTYKDMDSIKKELSPNERLALSRKLNRLVPQQVTEFIDYISPPPSVLPSPSSAHGDRVSALINWAKSTTGPGLILLRNSLEYFLDLP